VGTKLSEREGPRFIKIDAAMKVKVEKLFSPQSADVRRQIE